jgi:hypothetical protein
MTSTAKILVAVAVLLAACGGDDEMAPKPCAMWPVTITAGVNDAIDVNVLGSTNAAQIAAATYYSPPELGAAVEAALLASNPNVGSYQLVVEGVNDRLDFAVSAVSFVATLNPGAYGYFGFIAELDRALDAASAGFSVGDSGGKISISRGASWTPVLNGANAARSAWATVGFTAAEPPQKASWTADSGPVVSSSTWSCAAGQDGRLTVALVGDGAQFSLKFSTGANAATSARDVLGFGAVDTASATSATAGHQMENCWFAAYPAADDTGDLDDYHRAQTVSEAAVVKSIQYGSPRLARTVVLDFIPAHKMFIADEGANANEAIQRFFRYGWTRFRWFPDATDLATGTDYVLHIDSAKALPRNRLAPGTALYSVTLKMRRFVT